MPKKPGTNPKGEFAFFNVVYEDDTQRSNRRVPSELLGGLDGDEPARAFIREQDREIAEKSGRPPLEIKKSAGSGRRRSSAVRWRAVAAFLTFFHHKRLRQGLKGRRASVQQSEALFLTAGDDCDMKPSSKLLAWPALGRGLLVLGALTSWSGPAAFAQNIDEGKSAQQLFANSCATCHSNPRVLAKGRSAPPCSRSSRTITRPVWARLGALASYLASVDAPPARSRSAKQAKQKAGKRPPAPSAQPN